MYLVSIIFDFATKTLSGAYALVDSNSFIRVLINKTLTKDTCTARMSDNAYTNMHTYKQDMWLLFIYNLYMYVYMRACVS